MGDDGIEQLIVGEGRIVEAELVVSRSLAAQDLAHADPHLPDERDSLSRVGGFLRYSMTSGSAPLLRISANALRDVPQAGL